ncbi:MAG: ArnT family glycosyltransferase, partial [Anaerolineae bacterium]
MEDARELTTQVVKAGPVKRTRLRVRLEPRVVAFMLLFLILLAGAHFRFTGLDWDQGQRLHPDERFLTEVISSMSRPASVSEYFNTALSEWNPHNIGIDFFPYGTLPLFLVRFLGEVLRKTAEGEIYLVGRPLSGLFDLATVLLLFFIARRLYDIRVALLAAAFSAAAVLQIQQSHFMTVDTFATFFATLTFLFAVWVAENGRTRDYVLMGAALGLAVSSRINLAFLGSIAVAAGGAYVLRAFAAKIDRNHRQRAVIGVLVRLILAALVSLVIFRIFQPYAFQGPGPFGLRLNTDWLADMVTVRSLVSGEIDYPPGYQWINRPAYLFPLSHMVLWGLGLPLGVTAWAGFGLATWQVLRGRRWRHVLPVVWVLVEFGYHGQQFVKTMRYFLPIYPTLAMLAAFLLVWLWDRARAQEHEGTRGQGDKGTRRFSLSPPLPPSLSPLLPGTLALVVLGGTYLWAFAFTRIYTRPQTRIAATRWIYEHVPSAATIHYEASDGTTSHMQVPVDLTSQDDEGETSRLSFILTNGSGILYSDNDRHNAAGFRVPQYGTLQSVTVNYLSDPIGDPEPETFEVAVAGDPEGSAILTHGQVTAHLEKTSRPRGQSYTIELSGRVHLEPDREYYLLSRVVEGSPVQVWSSVLADEHWDYPLPLPLEEQNGFKMYHVFWMQHYNDDNSQKLDELLEWLDHADYIVITSNRLYGSIPRLPMRYPITTEYYRLLFEKTLGFELERTFTSYPSIGPIQIPDQSAEEAFTVYDHPKVWIFR